MDIFCDFYLDLNIWDVWHDDFFFKINKFWIIWTTLLKPNIADWFESSNMCVYNGVPSRYCYFKCWELLIREYSQSNCINNSLLNYLWHQPMVSKIISSIMGKLIHQHNPLIIQWFTLSKTTFSSSEIYALDYYWFCILFIL